MENLDKGLADAGRCHRPPAGRTRPGQLRELRVIMLAQGKRLDDVETGLRALSGDFPDEQAYQFQLAQFYASQGRVDEADAAAAEGHRARPRRTPTSSSATSSSWPASATARRPRRRSRPSSSRIPTPASCASRSASCYETTDRPDEARKTYASAWRAQRRRAPEGWRRATGSPPSTSVRASWTRRGRARGHPDGRPDDARRAAARARACASPTASSTTPSATCASCCARSPTTTGRCCSSRQAYVREERSRPGQGHLPPPAGGGTRLARTACSSWRCSTSARQGVRRGRGIAPQAPREAAR